MKVLYVELTNNGAWITGCPEPPFVRVVRVVLTEEQSEQIRPRHIAKVGDSDFFETVRPICIQDEEASRE